MQKYETEFILIPLNLPLVTNYYYYLQIKSIIIKEAHLLSYSLI